MFILFACGHLSSTRSTIWISTPSSESLLTARPGTEPTKWATHCDSDAAPPNILRVSKRWKTSVRKGSRGSAVQATVSRRGDEEDTRRHRPWKPELER